MYSQRKMAQAMYWYLNKYHVYSNTTHPILTKRERKSLPKEISEGFFSYKN